MSATRSKPRPERRVLIHSCCFMLLLGWVRGGGALEWLRPVVRTIKRDYVLVSPRPNAEAVLRQLPSWIAHYNEVHPHKALGYRSPREFIATYGP